MCKLSSCIILYILFFFQSFALFSPHSPAIFAVPFLFLWPLHIVEQITSISRNFNLFQFHFRSYPPLSVHILSESVLFNTSEIPGSLIHTQTHILESFAWQLNSKAFLLVICVISFDSSMRINIRPSVYAICISIRDHLITQLYWKSGIYLRT